jgi:hypothetical protein
VLSCINQKLYELPARYKIKEHRQHGEVASVDLAAVEAESVHVREVLARFAVKDRWNFDETALFAFAPPDRGLATKQMNGKKKSKFQLALALLAMQMGARNCQST